MSKRGNRAQVFIPPVEGIDWNAILHNPRRQPIVFTNRPSAALRLRLAGQPASAVMGMSEAALAKWLRERGGNAINKLRAH